MIYIKEVLDEVIFGTCKVRREIVGVDENDPNMIEWKAAYSLVDGSYIGDAKDAQFFEERGIMPQLRDKKHSTSSIGFCAREQKWYGWNHRGICGFGVGDIVKVGDCAFFPSNKKEFITKIKKWYLDDSLYNDVSMEVTSNGVRIKYEIHQVKSGKVFKRTEFKTFPKKWSRGEWTAKTLEDAKQMAIDFCEGTK